MKKALAVLLAALLFAGGFFLYAKIDAKIDSDYPWLPAYVSRKLKPNPTHKAEGPKHILFFFTDHWEPHRDEDVEKWVREYPEFARAHRDSSGVHPQHTFFWMFFYADREKTLDYLNSLALLSYEGFGEVEKHLHHDQDTSEGFIAKMNEAQGLANLTGANITAEARPQKTFGFIHGRWALDNSRGDKSCHVNDELILLRRLGCYADFTHPSWGKMHPRMVNEFYYATDDPQKPKSYDTGIPMKVGRPGVGDLLLITGQSTVRFEGLRPVYDHGEVDENHLPFEKRIDAWVREGVHVEGRPEWIFIKVFSHGAVPTTQPIVLGEWRRRMHRYLEEKYNDGENYILHYVTAREAYNIAKAAEAGKTGNPHDYRDFLIKPYVSRFFYAAVPFETVSFEDRQAVIRFLASAGSEFQVRIRAHGVQVSENLEVLSSEIRKDETVLTLRLKEEGVAGFTFTLLP